jgi:hypothetical protein
MSLKQKAELMIGTGMYFELPDSIKAKMPPGFGGGPAEETDYTRMVEKFLCRSIGPARLRAHGSADIQKRQ